MINTFYVFQVNIDEFIFFTKKLKMKLKDLNNCSYWSNKKHAIGWEGMALKKYPTAKLVEVEFKLKK